MYLLTFLSFNFMSDSFLSYFPVGLIADFMPHLYWCFKFVFSFWVFTVFPLFGFSLSLFKFHYFFHYFEEEKEHLANSIYLEVKAVKVSIGELVERSLTVVCSCTQLRCWLVVGFVHALNHKHPQVKNVGWQGPVVGLHG